jgi:hypothetical protein
VGAASCREGNNAERIALSAERKAESFQCHDAQYLYAMRHALCSMRFDPVQRTRGGMLTSIYSAAPLISSATSRLKSATSSLMAETRAS